MVRDRRGGREDKLHLKDWLSESADPVHVIHF